MGKGGRENEGRNREPGERRNQLLRRGFSATVLGLFLLVVAFWGSTSLRGCEGQVCGDSNMGNPPNPPNPPVVIVVPDGKKKEEGGASIVQIITATGGAISAVTGSIAMLIAVRRQNPNATPAPAPDPASGPAE